MLYMIFTYGWEPVLIQRILIGFQAVLEYKSWRLYKTLIHTWFSLLHLIVPNLFSIVSKLNFRQHKIKLIKGSTDISTEFSRF